MVKTSKNTGSKRTIIALLIVALIAIIAVVAFDATNNDISDTKTSSGDTALVTASAIVSSDGKAIAYDGVDSKNALELLKQYTTVETKTFSGLGEYVVSINAISAEDGKTYWSFYVNGQPAQVGAGDYMTKSSEKIEWRLEDVATFAQ